MAAADDTVIGNVVVDVGAGLSGLSDSFAQAVSQAQQAGQEIASALDGIDLGGDMEAALADIGNAATDATAGLGQLPPAMHDVAGASEEAAAGAEQGSRRLRRHGGEAYGAGRGIGRRRGPARIRERGADAYEMVQNFSVSMGLLTGSASKAEEVLGQIEQIAQTQPFSFPELLPAVQRLTAFGIQGELLTSTMQAAANAAAATGNGFDAVASALGRIELTGAVTARQLIQLGVSWQDIATAMGVSMADAQAKLAKGGQDAVTI